MKGCAEGLKPCLNGDGCLGCLMGWPWGLTWVVQIVTDFATDVQHVSQVLGAVTVAAVACVQQETAEMAGVLMQKVAVVQHSVVEYWLVEMQTFADRVLVDFV